MVFFTHILFIFPEIFLSSMLLQDGFSEKQHAWSNDTPFYSPQYDIRNVGYYIVIKDIII